MYIISIIERAARQTMIYLKEFSLPPLLRRELFINDQRRTCYGSYYPFDLFPAQEIPAFTFEPVTILCGGNGCGKSTLLNLIAEKVGMTHRTVYNRSPFFEDYLRMCGCETRGEPEAIRNGRLIASDDVFDYLLNIRCLNDGIDQKREELFDEYTAAKHARYRFRGLEDYDELKRFVDSRRHTQSRYVNDRLMPNVRERSNGESALGFFVEAIGENALYLLDEPENSLSAEKQLELVRHLSDSARFFGCQFIIATHSPFLLAQKGAKLYNLDAQPPAAEKWVNLPNMRAYFDFFMEHQREFE